MRIIQCVSHVLRLLSRGSHSVRRRARVYPFCGFIFYNSFEYICRKRFYRGRVPPITVFSGPRLVFF